MDKTNAAPAKVQIARDGPYLVSGGLPVHTETIGTNLEGDSVTWKAGGNYPSKASYALCRCGHSADKPFCDGTHARVKFDGAETASREPYRDQAKLIEGPTMSLTDADSLCAFARFCDPKGRVWNLVNQTDDPAARKIFIQEACDCPSGRLVAWDNATGNRWSRNSNPRSRSSKTRPRNAPGRFGCGVASRWSARMDSTTRCATALPCAAAVSRRTSRSAMASMPQSDFRPARRLPPSDAASAPSSSTAI